MVPTSGIYSPESQSKPGTTLAYPNGASRMKKASPRTHLAMGQKLVPSVNIPIPTKIKTKMGGAPTPKWDPIGLDNHSHFWQGESPIFIFTYPTTKFWLSRHPTRICRGAASQSGQGSCTPVSLEPASPGVGWMIIESPRGEGTRGWVVESPFRKPFFPPLHPPLLYRDSIE